MNDFINYKYNEIAYAKCVYENGFQTKHIPTELKLLLIYARDYLDIKKSKLKDFAYAFFESKVDGFNRVSWFKNINKAVQYASANKNRLIDIESIDITEGEVEYIKNLDISQDYKKLFFAFLVQMKLNKTIYEFKNQKEYTSTYFKGGIKKYNAIKKMANVSNKLDINANFIHDMSEAGYIGIYYNGLIKHLWMDDCKSNGNVILSVIDYDNVGYYFDYYCEIEGVSLCKDCGQPFKISKTCKSYCEKHKNYYKKQNIKTFCCIDCGKESAVPAMANHQKRCVDCQKIYRENYIKNRSSVQIN